MASIGAKKATFSGKVKLKSYVLTFELGEGDSGLQNSPVQQVILGWRYVFGVHEASTSLYGKGELFRSWKQSRNEEDRKKYCEAKKDANKVL